MWVWWTVYGYLYGVGCGKIVDGAVANVPEVDGVVVDVLLPFFSLV